MLYVQCKFRPEDTRAYTYAYDLPDDLVCGDEVKVPDKSGDGWKRVYVVDITDQAPSFACKKILGKVEPEAEVATPAVSAITTCPDCGQPTADCDCLPF